jgi:hypothetical protein
MRILRALVGSVVWLLACVLGLVGVLLCVTLILLPLGIPVLMLTRKLFALATALMVPRKVRHPVDELSKSARRKARKVKDSASKADMKSLAKAARRTRKKGRSVIGQRRKRFA